MKNVSAILFDMDGTLLDTAPDLYTALEYLCAEEKIETPDYLLTQNRISQGVAGIFDLTFNITPESQDFIDKRDRYLAYYSQVIGQKSRLFNGLEHCIRGLESAGVPWGIVTSKMFRFAQPLMGIHPCLDSSRCLIAGDTVTPGKPDPAPLFEACKRMDVEPEKAVYIGDAEKDIIAGNNAGMTTIVADWGYISAETQTGHWQADYRVAKSEELLGFMQAHL